MAGKTGRSPGGGIRLGVFSANSLTLFFRPNYTPEDVVNLGNLIIAAWSPAITRFCPSGVYSRLSVVKVEVCRASLPIVGLPFVGLILVDQYPPSI